MKKGLFDLNMMLLTIIFVIPSTFQFHPPAIPIGDFYITFVEICIFFLLVHWGALFFMHRIRGENEVPFTRIFLAVLGVLSLSLLFGISRYGLTLALGDFRQYLPLFLYFWVMRTLARPDRLKSIRERLFTVLAVVALYVIVIFVFFRPALFKYAQQNNMKVLENRVFFDNTLFLLFMYGGYLLNKVIVSKGRYIFFALVLALNLFMLILMQVRTYWVAFSSIVIFICWSQRRLLLRSRGFINSAFFVLLMVFTVLLGTTLYDIKSPDLANVSKSLFERANSLMNLRKTFLEDSMKTMTEVETIGTRVETAKVVFIDYILPNPTLGIGLGGEIPIINKLEAVILTKYQIDNGYLTILVKFGIIGFLVSSLLLVKVIRCLLRVVKSNVATGEEIMMARSLLVGIVAILISSLFSSVFVRQQTSIIAFLLLLAETSAMTLSITIRGVNQSAQKDA